LFYFGWKCGIYISDNHVIEWFSNFQLKAFCGTTIMPMIYSQ
jgi:hypothetical protein